MEFSFKDVIKVIKKNLIFIIATCLVFTIGAYCVSKFVMHKSYTTEVKLYVETTNDAVTSYDTLNSINYAEKLVATFIQMLDTNTFYTSVAEELDNKYSVGQIASSISFRSVEDTEVFEAVVVARSPETAKVIADAVAASATETIQKMNDHAKLKIVDNATVPKNPSSPNTKNNVLIAFIIGLVLSIIVSFVRDYFDVKIKYNEEMTSIYDLPVLATIPDFEELANMSKNKKNSKKH